MDRRERMSNVGVSSQDELIQQIEDERARGIFLSVLDIGTGSANPSITARSR